MNAPVHALPGLLHSVARSHVGLVRSVNEDRVFNCPQAGLWAVVDGMGGHHDGDVAAQMVVDALRALTSGGQPSLSSVLTKLDDVNATLHRSNAETRHASGATIVVALMDGDRMHIAWAGDSRAYRLQSGSATLLTHDHSLVQELVDAGILSAQQALVHPRANVVTRALGVDPMIAIDTTTITLESGEILLLCSDGLSRSQAAERVPYDRDVERLADALINTALAEDGSDNASLVLITER